jgi:hypothetical protein
MSTTTVEFVYFEGKTHRIEGRTLQGLRKFQSEGETLVETLERLAAEVDYFDSLEQQHKQQHDPSTLDYYLCTTTQ